jgi:MFS family permease
MADTVLGRSPLEGGLYLMRFTGAIPFGAFLGGYVVRWTGIRVPTIIGLLLGALGFILMGTWDQEISDPTLTIHLVTGGFGFGLIIAPLVLSAIESAPGKYRGTAASWGTVSRMLGMTLGLAALSAWGMGEFQLLTAALEFPLQFAGEQSNVYQARVTSYQNAVSYASFDVFHAFFQTGAALTLAAILPSMFIHQRRLPAIKD